MAEREKPEPALGVKKKMIIRIIFLLFIFVAPGILRADNAAAIEALMAQHDEALQIITEVCPNISEGIRRLKVMAGVSIVGGSVGIAGGTTAIVMGYLKAKEDRDLLRQEQYMREYAQRMEEIANEIEAMSPEEFFLFIATQVEFERWLEANRAHAAGMARSQMFGNIRTGAAFVAGAGHIVSATSAFLVGHGGNFGDLLDALESDMRECNNAAETIMYVRNSLSLMHGADFNHLARLSSIAENCGGFNPENVQSIRNRMRAAGWVHAAGAATGIAGGITSAIAVRQEGASPVALGARDAADGGTRQLNIAANALAVGTAVTAIAGTIVSGTTLALLNRNERSADACARALF